MKLFEQSDNYKKIADELIIESNLLSILKKYGEPIFVGAYSGNVMMSGDIDIHVIRSQRFTKKEVLDIYNDIFLKTQFNSYYIGDWNDTNQHIEFPEGYYIGLKSFHSGEKWKIDIWFVSEAEQKRRDSDKTLLNIAKVILTPEQRASILEFKRYRNEHKIKIAGQKIYELVLIKKISQLEEFVKHISSDIIK